MSTQNDTPNAEDVTSKGAIEEEFDIKSWRTDLTMKVEDRTLYVSKAVLGLTSPVFEAMFDRESGSSNSAEITLPGKKYSDFVEFLRCIYPNIAKPITESNVLSVMPLAIEYKVDNLRHACESYLLESLDTDISTERLCAILDRANVLNIKDVFDKCLLVAETRPFEDLEIACDKMAMSLIEKNKFVTRMFVDIKTKYENLMKQHKTARVLCRTLGEMSKEQKPLVAHFLQGCVSGETIFVAIKLPYEDYKSIKVGGYTFTIKFNTPFNTRGWLAIDVKCDEFDQDTCSLDCVSFVMLRNWMDGTNDIIQWKSFTMEKTNALMEMFRVDFSMILDKTKGFIYKGVYNFDIFLFVKQ